MGLRYKWVLHEGEKLFEVGILADGTLYNPRGYPEDTVRAAVQAANAQRHERRSKAAGQAAETRRRRQEKRIAETAKQLLTHEHIGPRHRCYICGKRLDDPVSIARGIGSECWQHILVKLEQANAAGRHISEREQFKLPL